MYIVIYIEFIYSIQNTLKDTSNRV